MKWSKVLFPVFLDLISGDNYSTFYTPAHNRQPDYFWNEALNVMSFHRDKMNEYLCKNYIASEMIETIANRTAENVQSKSENPKSKSKSSRLARESLLADPGSQKYKDWLSRSSTLEDIYRQFEHSENDDISHKEIGGGHEGEVTGYALVGHKHVYSKPTDYAEGLVYLNNGAITPTTAPKADQKKAAYFHSHGYYKDEDDEEHDEKGLKLKELFHFALTAIAFLAFACFVIEVIMCLMEVPQSTEPDYVLVPTTTGGTGHAAKVGTELPTTHRQERALNMDLLPLETLNEMSSKVLSSIEALTIIHEDDGQCLRRALCQSSKYSKTLPGARKIWLPFWSFGMSWIGDRFSKKKNDSGEFYTLEYLKAAVLGLGNSQCHVLYPKCDERRSRRKRKIDG